MKKLMGISSLVLVATCVVPAQEVIGTTGSQPVTIQMAGPAMAAAAGAQVKDDLFAGTEKFAKGASEVTEINLDPKMMGMVSNGKGGASDLARRMKFMVIHTYEYDKPGMYSKDDVDVFRKKLEDGTWSCSIHVREKDESTDICSRSSPDHEGSEMVILTAEPKELTFIHMSGAVSLSDLSAIGSNMSGGKNKGKEPKLKERDSN